MYLIPYPFLNPMQVLLIFVSKRAQGTFAHQVYLYEYKD